MFSLGNQNNYEGRSNLYRQRRNQVTQELKIQVSHGTWSSLFRAETTLFRDKIAKQLYFTSRTSTLVKISLWKPEEEELWPAHRGRIKIPQTPGLLFRLAIATGKRVQVFLWHLLCHLFFSYVEGGSAWVVQQKYVPAGQPAGGKAPLGGEARVCLAVWKRGPVCVVSELRIVGHVLSGAKDFCRFYPGKPQH